MFAPFHGFSGCQAFERLVRDLRAAGSIPDDVAHGYDLYHFSLLHKLRSARYHAQTMGEYLRGLDPTQVPPADIVYRVNFHFDGFLHVLGSGADIFAREVLTYFGITLPGRVYFSTAEDLIAAARPGDAILPLLASRPWRQEFSDYRNTATHESLVSHEYKVLVTLKGGKPFQTLQFPIPDDPRAWPRSYEHHEDIVEYCRLTFCRWLRLFNKAYTHLAPRVRAHGQLPL